MLAKVAINIGVGNHITQSTLLLAMDTLTQQGFEHIAARASHVPTGVLRETTCCDWGWTRRLHTRHMCDSHALAPFGAGSVQKRPCPSWAGKLHDLVFSCQSQPPTAGAHEAASSAWPLTLCQRRISVPGSRTRLSIDGFHVPTWDTWAVTLPAALVAPSASAPCWRRYR